MQATERRSSKVTAQWAAQLAAIREANTAAAHKVDTFIARLEGDVRGLRQTTRRRRRGSRASAGSGSSSCGGRPRRANGASPNSAGKTATLTK